MSDRHPHQPSSSAGPRAFLGITHTPLLGLNPLPAEVQQDLEAALAATRDAVLGWAPELIVIVGPDHYNGFFNALMPPFCIGDQAESVGDYLTPAGPLKVDAATAGSLAAYLMDEGFDMAMSRRMRVDHGFSQPLQLIWGGLDTPPLVPLFLNAVASPTVPRLARCLALGRALGRFLADEPRRTLLIGSGGLSHEPPVPTLAHPDPAVRERITVPREASAAEREAKTRRVMAAGMALAAGDPAIKPLNPAWDANWMDAIEDGRLEALIGLGEDSITREAGLSGHESKTWLLARAALPAGESLTTAMRWYREIPELVAGFGLLFQHQS